MSRKEFCRSSFVSGEEIAWHGEEPNNPDWSETSRLVAYSISNGDGTGIYIAFNSGHCARVVQLPKLSEEQWEIVVDTGMQAPFDVLLTDEYLDEATAQAIKTFKATWLAQGSYPMLPYSCIVLTMKTRSVDKTQKTEKALF